MPDGVESSTEVTQSMAWQTATRTSSNSGMDIEDFYKLLAAQLKYQDMDNPMDTSEMMAQMVQTQMIQTITEMNQMSYITYAASFMGKEVTVGEVDANGYATNNYTTGVVEGVNVTANPPTIFVDGKKYQLSQIVAVGKLPTISGEDDGEEEDPDAVDGEGKDPDAVDGEGKDPDAVGGEGKDPDAVGGTEDDENKSDGTENDGNVSGSGDDTTGSGSDGKVEGLGNGENVTAPDNGPADESGDENSGEPDDSGSDIPPVE